MRRVFFVGPLPPPVHGFAVINGHMLVALRASGGPVEVFDLAPKTLLTPLLKWFSYVVAVARHAVSGGCTLYLPISGGIRQLIDLAFAVPACLLGMRLFVHHHSFAYLNARPWFSQLAFAILGKATHIVLCPAMGQRLCAQYGIDPTRIRVLSNAAFLELPGPVEAASRGGNGPLTLGFLSNITAEKGIFSFFETLKFLRVQQVPVTALIAGPVSAEIQGAFAAQLAKHPEARHLGPVYGNAKTDFFAQVDVLLFPTQYANEAEPVTLWESMAHGVPVIAMQRGCIEGMVPAASGCVVHDLADYPRVVSSQVLAMQSTPGLMAQRRFAARAAFEQGHSQSRQALQSLLHEMTSPDVKGHIA